MQIYLKQISDSQVRNPLHDTMGYFAGEVIVRVFIFCMSTFPRKKNQRKKGRKKEREKEKKKKEGKKKEKAKQNKTKATTKTK